MLITPEYLEQNRKLHAKNMCFGANGGVIVNEVLGLINKHNITSVLDYGAGKGGLRNALKLNWQGIIREYEPCFEKDQRELSDLVVCRDVLEHIEPKCLDEVLDDIRRLTGKALYATIATRLSSKCLPDGRNAHLIVQEYEWWKPKIESRFKIATLTRKDGEFTILAT